VDPNVRSHAITAFCVAASLGTALATDDLGLVIAISGAVCDCLLIYIMPPLMYFKLTEKDGRRSCLSRLLPLSSIATGSVIGVVGTTTSLLVACGYKVPAR